MANPVGMLPQDRAELDAVVRATYERYQGAKASGMADYVMHRGPDTRIHTYRQDGKPTRYKHGGRTWREVGVLMYGEDFAEALAVRLDRLQAGRVR